MEFKHLPVAGGLYDQHPDFLDRMMYILAEQGKERKRQEAAESRKNGGTRGRRPRGGY